MKTRKKLIKFGILGLGRVVDIRVAKVFKSEVKQSKVVAVYDKDKKKNKKFSKLFNLPITKSLNNFLNKKMDFVYIATESGNHAEHIMKCFNANKNVIVEKPPVLRVNQLINLEKVARKKKLLFYVIYQNRLNRSVVFVKKILDDKLKKKIIFVNLKLLWCRKQNYYNDWHGKWKHDGGVIAMQGIHYIDLLCHLFGKPIKCISHQANKSNKLQAEDTNIGLITFQNGINCQVSFTTALRPEDIEASIEIVMQKKTIKLCGVCCNRLDIKENTLEQNYKLAKYSQKYSEVATSGYGISHSRSLQMIINKAINKKNNLSPLRAIDTLDTLKLLNMMYKSYEKQRWVHFNEKSFQTKLGY
jgi:predicted dehydrogenase|tara:strand:+ start:1793 stop:2866 length:1074 start_codon:yes stop_codon:yes gene_type:complete